MKLDSKNGVTHLSKIGVMHIFGSDRIIYRDSKVTVYIVLIICQNICQENT